MPVIRLRIVGRVQGVGFRWFVCEKAEEFGISGWVKNTSDGDVELVASGDEAKLAQLEAAVSRGPAGANVQRVDHLPSPTGASYPSPFKIER
jgi:acylphosphatase